MSRALPSRPAAWLGLALLLAGCAANQPTRFYTLSALPPAPGEAAEGGPVVGVEPVPLPGYLDRPQIVAHTGPNRMSLADFDVWVEPLEAMFTRVLTQNLSVLLGSDDVVDVSQVRDLPLDYRVTVAVSRFDVGEDGQAVLDARWAVYGRGGGRLIRQDRSLITHPVAGPGDYGEIAAAMSAAVQALSREIGVVIAQARSG